MENIQQTPHSTPSKLKFILGLSIPFKILLSAFITSLAGTTYFSFISDYSIYYYAIHNGFRLPSEGSPFVVIAVSAITFIVLLSAAFFFIFIYTVAELIHFTYEETNNYYESLKKTTERLNLNKTSMVLKFLIESRKKKISAKFTAVISLLLFLILLFAMIFSKNTNQSWWISILVPVFGGLYPMLISLPFIESQHKLTWCASISAIYIIFAPIVMMDEKIQSEILSRIKYGGNAKITLHFENSEPRDFNLVFRSSQSLFVRAPENKTVTEIPLSEIKSIDYLSSD